MNIIIYGSQYGTTKKYADELAKRTGFEVKSYKYINDINNYETIIYLGALYAGGVLGLKKIFSKMQQCENKKIIIGTVGLSDPTNIENINNIRNSVKKQLSKKLYENAHIIHLRGGINYSKLGFVHKNMMRLLYKKAVGLSEEKKTAEVKAMIETYNQKVDFVDFEKLNSIINMI